MEGLKRGELAKKALVSIETIRYYEQSGLLPIPKRTEKNYRIFPAETLLRIRFIKRAKQLGFSLHEIKELIFLRTSSGPRGCEEVIKFAQLKLHDLDSKIQNLRAMRKTLSRLKDRCPGKGSSSSCPMLEALESENYRFG